MVHTETAAEQPGEYKPSLGGHPRSLDGLLEARGAAGKFPGSVIGRWHSSDLGILSFRSDPEPAARPVGSGRLSPIPKCCCMFFSRARHVLDVFEWRVQTGRVAPAVHGWPFRSSSPFPALCSHYSHSLGNLKERSLAEQLSNIPLAILAVTRGLVTVAGAAAFLPRIQTRAVMAVSANVYL